MSFTSVRMCSSTGLLFLILLAFELSDFTHADEATDNVSDLRTLGLSMGLLENKLERHEMRERALGEVLKRGLQALQRGQRNIETPLLGFEQRLNQIESLLKRMEIKFDQLNYESYKPQVSQNYQEPRVYQAMLPLGQQVTLPRRLVKKSEDNKSEISDQLTAIRENVENLLDISKPLLQQSACRQHLEPVDHLLLPPSVVEKEGDKINISEQVMKISTNVETLLETSNYLRQQTSLRTTVPFPTITDEFENKLIVKFDELATSIRELRAQDKIQNEYTFANADRELLHALTNNTLGAIKNVEVMVQTNTDKVYTDLATLIKQLELTLRSDADIILMSINRQTDWLRSDYKNTNINMEIFNDSKTAPQNSTENMLFGELFDKQREEIVSKLETILKALDGNFNRIHTEAMQNLNNTIKNESSYIWRQISITNGDISRSTELLREIHSRSEVFVNSVLQSMVSIGDKVENIKLQMADIHTNQDYLLDNLTLLLQKFDVTKEKVSNIPE